MDQTGNEEEYFNLEQYEVPDIILYTESITMA